MKLKNIMLAIIVAFGLFMLIYKPDCSHKAGYIRVDSTRIYNGEDFYWKYDTIYKK